MARTVPWWFLSPGLVAWVLFSIAVVLRGEGNLGTVIDLSVFLAAPMCVAFTIVNVRFVPRGRLRWILVSLNLTYPALWLVANTVLAHG